MPEPVESGPPPPPRPPRKRRRRPWVLLGLVLVLGMLLAFLPTLFGGFLLDQFGKDAGITAGSVSGPLWSPQLGGVKFEQPGISVTAGSAGVTVASVNPLTRTVRLNVRADDATVNLKLQELFKGGGGGAAGGGGWKVLISGLDVRNTRVSIDGKGVNIPDGQFSVQPGENGKLAVRGRTPEGELNADVLVSEGASGNIFTVDLDADARVINKYWPGVTAGRITGRYVFGDGPIRGDLKVTNVALQVKEAKFVTVTGINGGATHRGDKIALKLAGTGWDGPVTATGGVDLKAQNWTVSADATPTVSGLARALGAAGEGNLKLRVTAGGWSTVRVTAYVQGAGKFAGIGFRDANAEYTFLNENGNKATQANDLAFSADTELAGAEQKLEGRWAFGRKGQASLAGSFGQKPLDVQASIDAGNVLTLSGQGLGGPLSGTLALQGVKINAQLQPTYGAAKAKVALSGTPDNLRAVVTQGVAGPFPLSGVVTLNKRGLQADLGTVQLDLDRDFRGSWIARNLTGAGVTLSGQGRINLTGGDLMGTLSAQVPGLPDTLSGPLNLNYVQQRGTFMAGRQTLTWNGDAFALSARNLRVAGGLTVNGDATVTNTLKLFGTLTARGNGFNLSAVGRGNTASLRGLANGVTVLADANLSSPYTTTARIQGTNIQGVLSVQNGIRFNLNTAGQTARGVINGENWDAVGRVNLASLRPLIGVKDLSGTLELNLAGRGGTAQVNTVASGVGVTGTLTRVGGPFNANLRAVYGEFTALLRGRVYPDVQASGTLSGQGQTLNATLSGPYSALRATATGRTGELSFSGVTLPAQAVKLRGNLTPKLAVTGTWGDLNVNYDGGTGLVRVAGRQNLTAFGQAGQLQGRATWGPGKGGAFLGAVDARGVLDQYTVAFSGPWSNLSVLLTDGEGLQAQGTASLPEGRYNVRVRGPVAGGTQAGGLFLDGNIQGRGTEPRGKVNVLDGLGGSAVIDLRGFSNFDVIARGLTLAKQPLSGSLQARNNVLNGALTAGPLRVTAANGLIRAQGVLAGQQVSASGRLTLPATISDLNLRVDGPYFTAVARGGVADLRGTLTIKPQRFGNDPARLSVPQQSFPLRGSLTGLRANVGGLIYQGGRYSGGLSARYDLSGRGGTVRVAGTGLGLAALPSGPVAGRLNLIPTLGGTLTANLSPFQSLIPAQLRAQVVPGQLVAQVTATGATLTTRNSRYLGDPLGLSARVSWKNGFTASGTLTHPSTRIPVRYDGQNLSIDGALLSGRALQPLLPGVKGEATLVLSVPNLKFEQASGQARVNLMAQGQRAVGLVRLSRGQLSADLTSTLSGVPVRVVGPIYPQADAVLTVDGVRATLTGNAAETLTLRAVGTYQRRALDITATASRLTGGNATAQLSGVVAGAALNLNLNQGRGNGLSAWNASGSLSVPDLKPLTGSAGRLNATLGGTLADLKLNATGEVAGVKFSAPALYRGGALLVQGASAQLAQGRMQASGQVFPNLALNAKVTLTDLLPGTYAAQVGGTFSKLDVTAQGALSNGKSGLQAGGSRVAARLLGQDWKATFTGVPLKGTVRGRLGANALGGLLDAGLTVHAPFISGETKVRLDGTTGWNARTGWQGTLRAVGNIPGGPLDAVLQGQGVLNVGALVGTGAQQARLSGSLPASLPFKPGGTLDLAAFDVGALWGRAAQLRLTGRATLAGKTWNVPEANFVGAVQDSQNELTGDLGASYRAGDISVRLAGPKVAGGGTLGAGKYNATLRADTLHLARLLPEGLDVNALTFAGTVEASGTLAGGPQHVLLRNVALRGQQQQAGPFALYGTATYTPDTLQTALSGSLRGGVLSAQGSLPAGVRVTVHDLSTEYLRAASFGKGKLDADLTLRGPMRDPSVNGTLNARTDALDAFVALSGQVRHPRANARLTLKGSNSGTLYADARDLNLAAGTVRARVYGTVQSGSNTAKVDLDGVWPQLGGQIQATLDAVKQPVTLVGDGRGNYTLNDPELGRAQLNLLGGDGFLPKLTGTLDLTPLPLVNGSGELRLQGTLAGTLAAPTVLANLTSRNAAAYGVKLADTTGSFSGTLAELSGTLAQAGVNVATLKGQTLSLNALQVEVAGSAVKATGTASLSGAADVNLTASGTLDGNLKATYQARSLSVVGNLSGPQNLQANIDLKADPFTGWHGTTRLSGGPTGSLTRPLNLTVSGPLAHPLVTGEGGLLGATARVVATARGVQVRLVDGRTTTASGVIELRPDPAGEWLWSGAASLSRPELSLSVTPSGPMADPQVLLSVRRGEWRASGPISLKRADLSLSDGEKSGTLSWQQGQLSANLPGLNLARLDLPGVSGIVTAEGNLSTETQNGQVSVQVANLSTPYEVPYLGLALDGEVNASVTLKGGKPGVQAQVALPSGALTVTATQGEDYWTGRVTGTLRRDQGLLDVNVGASGEGLSGAVKVSAYPVDIAGQNLKLGGDLKLLGQSFQATLDAVNSVGTAQIDASGGIADLLPSLESVLAVQPTDEGYNLRASLNDLEISNLKIAPALSGRVNGEANISDGGGTFSLTSGALKVGPKTLSARIAGTQVAGDWRIQGYLGNTAQSLPQNSEFTAGLSGGEVFGQGTLRALPLGAVVGAVVGTTPGEGVVTGVVRFRFPLADPTAGTATVVAERIRVSATSGEGEQAVTETLTGSGSIDLAQREIRSVNVQLSGAGTWDVRGQYTREKVDLTAQFTNTTFTPVLLLLPALADLTPSLKGTVTLSAAGTYERPRGLLRMQNITGTLAGLSLQIPQFAGDLPDSGAFTGGGSILTGGAVGSNGKLDVRGQLTLGKLSGTTVAFAGLLAPQALGSLPNTTAVITQAAESRWTISAQSRSTNPTTGAGVLTLTGDLSPKWDLTLAARNYNLPLNLIYGRESALNADIRAVDDGTLIRVSGAADFLRLTLGRVNATTIIPAPGQTTTSSDSQKGRATDNYASPLPEEYTTFPKPVQAGADAIRPARPFLERIVLEDIPIRASNGIRVDENLVRADFSGNLTLSGTGAKPRLAGDIRSQRGFIYLRENEFTLADSTVTFSGENLYPKFDITANGVVRASTSRGGQAMTQNVPVTLNFAGEFVTQPSGSTALALKTTLRCTVEGENCRDPNTAVGYTEPELYALVVTGVPNLTALPDNLGALGTSALQTALNVFILGELERTIAKSFGLDVFRFTPQIITKDGTVSDLNATITLGSYLSRNLYLQYQVDLTGKGLINATYTTPDNRFTFQVSTSLTGLNLESIRPSFSTAYNINDRTSVSIGVENTELTTKLKFGVNYRFGTR